MSLNCVNANNGLRVYNDGTAMLCCMSKDHLTDQNGKVASVRTHGFQEIMNGRKAIEIREDLKNGVRHSNCQRCWNEEDAGLISKRLRDNKTFEFDEGNSDLKIVELNLGTTCNLKCRICGPWSSSQWNKEFIMIKQWKGSEADYKNWLYDLNHSYDDDSKFWEELKNNISTIERIEMYGGEPFMVKKQWEILKYSIDKGYSKHQKLHFNTNGTFFDWEKIEILREFKKVDISFSIDGLEKHFEYQRHPAVWNEVVDNLKRFQYVANKYFWDISVCITVNNYNIFYLDRTLDFFRDLRIKAYLNFLHDPPRHNITNLREDIKEHLTKRYLNLSTDSHTKMWLKKAVEYMNLKQCDRDHWNSFLRTTKQLDEIRNEDFKTVFPEYCYFVENEDVEKH